MSSPELNPIFKETEMRVIILEDAEEVSQRASEVICNKVRQKADVVLGLATGGTPLKTYQRLVAESQSGTVDFSQVHTFNLDEYVGLPPDHPQSYYTFMHQNLFEPAGFASDRCHLPSGTATNLLSICDPYEQMIDESGGIELQLLGIGTDGHIAFNEPGSSLGSRTRIKALTERTRRDNARFFDSPDQVPTLAITMGIGTILDSDTILLLATGESKAKAVQAFVEGPITANVPASALQMHPRVTVMLDQAAASLLQRADYYRYVETVQRTLETNASTNAE